MGFRIYAISTGTREDLEGYQRKLGEAVTLLADPELKATKAWGMLDGRIARSGTFALARSGAVVVRWLPTHYHSRPDADEVLAALR